MVSFSFKGVEELSQFPEPLYWLPQRPTLFNYADAFGTFTGLKAIWESLSIASASTIFAILIGFPAAYAVSRYGIRRTRLSLFLIPLVLRVMPAMVLAIPLLVFYNTFGLIDTAGGMVLVYGGTTVFYVIWLIKPFIDAVPREIEEAAMMDGVARWRVLYWVTLPTVVGGVIIAAFFVFMLNWTEFVFVLSLGRIEIQTIPVVMTSLSAFGVLSGAHGDASAVSTISLLPFLVGAYYLQKQLLRVSLFGLVGR
jgi:multiple sugar transport system permease protein